MSDTLQEREDARTRHEQIGGEYRCNKCRAEFKTIPDFDKHECKQQREDQTGEHQVNRSGVCQIPGCPCRGWSAQGRITYACPNCGKVDEHSDNCPSRPRTSKHQPAARGGGEGERFGFVVFTGRHKILDYHKPDGQQVATVDDEDSARLIVRALNQHQALVAERERLLEAVKEVAIRSLRYCEQKYGHDDQARLNLEALVESIEQRSASE